LVGESHDDARRPDRTGRIDPDVQRCDLAVGPVRVVAHGDGICKMWGDDVSDGAGHDHDRPDAGGQSVGQRSFDDGPGVAVEDFRGQFVSGAGES
jgi:hypothetical protein